MTLAAVARSCYLCGATEFRKEWNRVRDTPDVYVIACAECGLVSLSRFDHISDRFYSESGMHGGGAPDVADWLGETQPDDDRRAAMLRDDVRGARVLDFGCGNGGFLQRVRAEAAYVCGVDLERALKPHFAASGIPFFADAGQAPGNFDLITLFHVLEHVPDPRTLLKKLAGRLSAGGELIVEVPNADDALIKLYQSAPFKNFTYWSCHLFLFNAATLTTVVQQSGLGLNHIRHVQRYPLSNHLHWLATGRPGGHETWSFLDSPQLTEAYQARLESLGQTDTLFASVSVR